MGMGGADRNQRPAVNANPICSVRPRRHGAIHHRGAYTAHDAKATLKKSEWRCSIKQRATCKQAKSGMQREKQENAQEASHFLDFPKP
jgi:hypothetical protein